MIEFLNGKIIKKNASGIILDVRGVGYGIELPLPSLCEIKVDGSECGLWIFTRVKEDSIKLYGFANEIDKRAFAILLSVSGVGPKVALAILSTLSVNQLAVSLENRDTGALESVPGIGKRTAEKILLELKTRLDQLLMVSSSDLRWDGVTDVSQQTKNGEDLLSKKKIVFDEACSALENLGFKKKDFSQLLSKIVEKNRDITFEDLVRLALSEVSKSKKDQSCLKNTNLNLIF